MDSDGLLIPCHWYRFWVKSKGFHFSFIWDDVPIFCVVRIADRSLMWLVSYFPVKLFLSPFLTLFTSNIFLLHSSLFIYYYCFVLVLNSSASFFFPYFLQISLLFYSFVFFFFSLEIHLTSESILILIQIINFWNFTFEKWFILKLFLKIMMLQRISISDKKKDCNIWE